MYLEARKCRTDGDLSQPTINILVFEIYAVQTTVLFYLTIQLTEIRDVVSVS